MFLCACLRICTLLGRECLQAGRAGIACGTSGMHVMDMHPAILACMLVKEAMLLNFCPFNTSSQLGEYPDMRVLACASLCLCP